MRHQCLVYFFCRASETFNIANIFFSVKISLTAPKIMYLDTYKIFFNALLCRHLVKYKNKDSERTGTILSTVIKLSLSYTDPYLLAEFIQIG